MTIFRFCNQHSEAFQITWDQYFRRSALDSHVDALCAKVASRLYFLKILKRSGLSSNDLVCFYICVIRSVVEMAAWYGTTIWTLHRAIDSPEVLQKRALRRAKSAPGRTGSQTRHTLTGRVSTGSIGLWFIAIQRLSTFMILQSFYRLMKVR